MKMNLLNGHEDLKSNEDLIKWQKKSRKGASSVKAIQPNYINVLIWARKPLTKSN